MRVLLTTSVLVGFLAACSTPVLRVVSIPAPDAGSSVIPDGGESDGGGQDPCGPDNCPGCCNESGACLTGQSSEACGHGGESCVACGDSVCSASGSCVMQTTNGERCADAVELKPNSSGYAQIAVDLAGFRDDFHPSCGTPGAKDAVFWFDVLNHNSYVEITATPTAGSNARPVVTVPWTCTDVDGYFCSTPGNDGVTRAGLFLGAGRFFIWLESLDSAGSVELELRKRPPASTGDSCAAPKALSFTGNSISYDDDLSLYAPDGFSCASGRRDAVYSFSLAEKSEVTVTVTPKASTFDPNLQVEAGGCGVSSRSCIATQGSGQAETTTVTLEAGTHSIMVSTEDGSYGLYNLHVEKR